MPRRLRNSMSRAASASKTLPSPSKSFACAPLAPLLTLLSIWAMSEAESKPSSAIWAASGTSPASTSA